MKFVIAGASGFVGGEVLAQCRKNPAISSIVALTRRPLAGPAAADPKVQTVVMKNFTSYPEDVVQKPEGADACVWALGARVAVPEVEIEYPRAFARAMAATRTARQFAKPFRYVYCSGVFAERDQTKPLWVSQTIRHVKGEAENSMIAFADEHQGSWETYIVKPATILRCEGNALKSILGVFGTVRVNELAAAMIDIVSNGSKEQTYLNAEIITKGRESLAVTGSN